jgi:hypothetical protein
MRMPLVKAVNVLCPFLEFWITLLVLTSVLVALLRTSVVGEVMCPPVDMAHMPLSVTGKVYFVVH